MPPKPLSSRREFLASTSCFGAAVFFARNFPVPALAEPIARDSRVAETPLVDKGFASVRKIGQGVYGTISDFSKGAETLSNGGFVIGSEVALIVEGHCAPAGAAFELEALRMVSRLPVRAALDTHYHFDHSLGNAFYGGQGIPVWAHPKTGPLMVERYASLQGQDMAALLEPFEKRLRDAASESDRQHAQGDLNAFRLIFGTIDSTVVALPSHPLDPAKMPMTVDLGGVKAVIETYPGHTPSDLIIRVPEQNIVFTGDLLFNAWYPPTLDANMRGWRDTLEKFAAFDKETLFVPGHGQLCGQEAVATFRAIFDDLADHAGRMYKQGVPAEEATSRYVIPERFKNFVVFAWSICVGTAIAKYYEDLKVGKS